MPKVRELNTPKDWPEELTFSFQTLKPCASLKNCSSQWEFTSLNLQGEKVDDGHMKLDQHKTSVSALRKRHENTSGLQTNSHSTSHPIVERKSQSYLRNCLAHKVVRCKNSGSAFRKVWNTGNISAWIRQDKDPIDNAIPACSRCIQHITENLMIKFLVGLQRKHSCNSHEGSRAKHAKTYSCLHTELPSLLIAVGNDDDGRGVSVLLRLPYTDPCLVKYIQKSSRTEWSINHTIWSSDTKWMMENNIFSGKWCLAECLKLWAIRPTP